MLVSANIVLLAKRINVRLYYDEMSNLLLGHRDHGFFSVPQALNT